MTWEELRQHLVTGSRVLHVGREAIVLSYADSEDQRIRVELVRAFDEAHVLFLSPIVAEAKAQMRDALALNMKLGLGAVALEQGYLVMRATRPLGPLDRPSLDRHVGFVVGEALRLRRIHGELADTGPGELFRD